MKVLAAAQPLSLQAHPDRSQAELGFAREEDAGIPRDAPTRTYKDDWPKPEALCALGDFHALCGFREPAETYALIEVLDVPAALDLVHPLRAGGAAELRQVFGDLLRLSGAATLVGEVVRAATTLTREPGSIGQFARTAVELAAHHPQDPGVLAGLLLNRVLLHRYEALYLPAGNLHAYLSGTGVEIMANSDNVLRGGLTSKHIDVDQLLEVLDFTPGWAGPVPVTEEAPGIHRYRTGAPEFELWRLEVDGQLPAPADGLGRVLLATDGSARVRSADQELSLAAGQSVFLRADDEAVLLGRGTVFIGTTGQA
jgi:mannose-6-phosphate isomerase